MGRLLLDTHVVLWALLEPDRLSARVRDLVRDRRTTVFVSATSAWEIATKHRLGKLPDAGDVVSGYGDHLRRLGVDELPMTSVHALTAGSFAVDHRDPFDRMLAAQALHEGVPIATSDLAFDRFPCSTVW